MNLRVWATIFEGKRLFFQTWFVSLFLPSPYTRMCVSTIGSFSHFLYKKKTQCKTRVEFWFWVFSRIFDFSVYFNYLWGRPFGGLPPFPPSPPPNPPPQAPRRAPPPDGAPRRAPPPLKLERRCWKFKLHIYITIYTYIIHIYYTEYVNIDACI